MPATDPPIPGYDLEVSHDKVRPPPLPRVSDLTEPTGEERRRGRGEDGKFGADNDAAKGRAWKAAIRARIREGIRSAAPDDADVQALVSDGWLLFVGALRELPSDGQLVRSQLAFKIVHEVLAAWWQRQVFARGLGTPASIEAEDRFRMHVERVERLTASVLGAAKAMVAVRSRSKGVTWEALHAKKPKGSK